MFLTIIFGLLLILSIILLSKESESFFGGFLLLISLFVLIPNTVELCTVSYDYDKIVTKRNSLETTLIELRKNEDNNEKSSVGLKIIEFNEMLAIEKLENESWFYDIYIDDRINSINPIK